METEEVLNKFEKTLSAEGVSKDEIESRTLILNECIESGQKMSKILKEKKVVKTQPLMVPMGTAIEIGMIAYFTGLFTGAYYITQGIR